MSDDKPKPVDDLKEGLGLLFRAAKGAVDSLPMPNTEKVEGYAKDAAKGAKDAAKEVTRKAGSAKSKAVGWWPF